MPQQLAAVQPAALCRTAGACRPLQTLWNACGCCWLLGSSRRGSWSYTVKLMKFTVKSLNFTVRMPSKKFTVLMLTWRAALAVMLLLLQQQQMV